MIVASAVRLKDGRIFVGSRHGDCYAKMKSLGIPKDECNSGAVQGFVDDYLNFMNRNQAYYYALDYDQCEEKYFNPELAKLTDLKEEDWKPILASEDLW